MASTAMPVPSPEQLKRQTVPQEIFWIVFCAWLIVCVGGFSACIAYGLNEMRREIAGSAENIGGECLLIDYEEIECQHKCNDVGGGLYCTGYTYLYTALMEDRCGDQELTGIDERCEGSSNPRTDLSPPDVKDIYEEYTCYLTDCDEEFSFTHDGTNYFKGLWRIILGIIGILSCPCFCGYLWVKYWRHQKKGYEETGRSTTVVFE